MKTQDQNSVKPDAQSCQMAVSGSVILPSQLRCGNTIEYFISTDDLGWLPTVIDWQDIRLCHEQNESFNLEHRKIPLTEKYISLYFQKDLDGFYRKNKGCLIEILFHDKGVQVCSDSVCLNHIQFVNDFENLFFSLYGRDLTDR